jgi:hypothetical protein
LRRAVSAVGLLAAIACTPVYGQGASPPLLSPAAAPASANAQKPDLAVIRQKPVAVNLNGLDAPAGKEPKQMSVELFDGKVVTINLERLERRGASNYTWHGRIQGEARSQVILTVVNGQLAGSVVLGDGGPNSGGSYQIQPGANGTHYLRQIDQRTVPPDHPPGDNGALPPPFRTSSPWESDRRTLAIPGGGSRCRQWPQSARWSSTATGGGGCLCDRLRSASHRRKPVYANSGVTLRLVHYAQVSYNDSGDFPTDLNRLTSSSDGYMDNVHSLRNTYGADMVSLFVENMQYCGYGWIGPAASSAFSVISRGCASSNYSFPHELGHNFGTRHDTYVDSSTSPYAYGHGWVNTTQGWRDVMAYNNACAAVGKNCTRIAYLSNPTDYGTQFRKHDLDVRQRPFTTSAPLSPASGWQPRVAARTRYRRPARASAWRAVRSASRPGPAAREQRIQRLWLTIAPGPDTDSGTSTMRPRRMRPARSAAITVGNQAFTVSQATGCTYTLNPTSASVGAAGATGSFTLTTGATCTWSIGSGASWLAVTSATSGTGNATVAWSAAANTGAQRSANLNVGGATFMVTESAAAAPVTGPVATLSSSALSFGTLKVGTKSAARTVTLTNSGGGTLTIAAMTPGGANPGDFSRAGTCAVNTALTGGQSCTLQYTFTPGAKGSRSASLAVGTSAGTVGLGQSGRGK